MNLPKNDSDGYRQISVRLPGNKKREFHRACFDADVGMQHYLEIAVDRMIAFNKKKLSAAEAKQHSALIGRARTLMEQNAHG